MTSWHLIVSARLIVEEIHADAKNVGPFAQASVTGVQNANIKQDRLPNYGSSKRDRKSDVCACLFACKVISLQLKFYECCL